MIMRRKSCQSHKHCPGDYQARKRKRIFLGFKPGSALNLKIFDFSKRINFMKKIMKSCLILITATLFTLSAQAEMAWQNGSTIHSSDGSWTRDMGGGMYHNSNGTTSRRVGNFMYNSDGTSSQRIGNQIIHNDGTVCIVNGNLITSNPLAIIQQQHCANIWHSTITIS